MEQCKFKFTILKHIYTVKMKPVSTKFEEQVTWNTSTSPT